MASGADQLATASHEGFATVQARDGRLAGLAPRMDVGPHTDFPPVVGFVTLQMLQQEPPNTRPTCSIHQNIEGTGPKHGRAPTQGGQNPSQADEETMSNLIFVSLTLSLLLNVPLAGLAAASSSHDRGESSGHAKRQIRPLITAIDYHTRMIYIFNYKRDAVVTVDPLGIDEDHPNLIGCGAHQDRGDERVDAR